MSEPLVSLDRRPDGVALIRLERPPANALSRQLLHELHQIVIALDEDLPGAVVVAGSERFFAAGAEISEFGGPAEAREIGAGFHTALDALAALPRTSIAAVNGYALGGGCELALACDLRVAGEGARFGQPEILLGIIPGGGGTQRLPRLVGSSVAKDLILTGRQVDAAEAARIGLVNRVVPDGEVLEAALGWAAELAAGPLVAQAMAKRAIDQGVEISISGGLDLERQLFEEVFATEDAGIGVRSFLDNGPGKARFTGR